MQYLTPALLLVAFLAAPALAQQAPPPDPIQDVAQDWQGQQFAQTHLLRSVQTLVAELQAARARIKELEAQLPKKAEASAPKK